MGNCGNVKGRPTDNNRPISRKQKYLLDSNSSSGVLENQQSDY